MAESDRDTRTGHTQSESTPRRRSIPLILAGVLTVLVAVAGLVGTEAVHPLFDLPLGWLAVISATAVGALLLFKPDRKRN